MKNKSIGERFWNKVDKSRGGCWNWLGCVDKDGYGIFSVYGKNIRAHRFSWKFSFGLIPKDSNRYGTFLVCHTCDNPSCVNPKHLFLGTQSDNAQDMWNKGRNNRSGENHGRAKLTEENVKKIRLLYDKTNLTQKKIAMIYNIHPVSIHCVVKNKTWTHI